MEIGLYKLKPVHILVGPDVLVDGPVLHPL